jgi:23S rRNA pseudouridine955/2504/2580 synthase
MASCVPPSSPAVRFLTVDPESDGQRVDNFLLRELRGAPKTLIYRIIRSGEVRLNKGRVQADSRVSPGDVLRIPPIRLPMREEGEAAKVPGREFPILYEDDLMLAVNKPAGVAVHGGSGVSYGVIEQLRRARPEARLLELVHRLDRETSGILLVAKKKSALRHLQNQFRERATGKTYLALVAGIWPAQRKVIDLPLHKYLLPDGERRVKVTTPEDPDGMRSISLVRPIGPVHPPREGALSDQAFTLLAVTIKTGRTHQIRVHLAHGGHPIAGDDKYGDFALNRELQRQGLGRMFLHAWQLHFSHPLDEREMQLKAPLPPELIGWGDVGQYF